MAEATPNMFYGATAASASFQAIGSFFDGIAAREAGKMKRDAAEFKAWVLAEDTKSVLPLYRRRASQAISSKVVQYAVAGVGSGGSAFDVVMQEVVNQEREIVRVKTQGITGIANWQTQAVQANLQAKLSMNEGMQNVAGAIGQGAADIFAFATRPTAKRS